MLGLCLASMGSPWGQVIGACSRLILFGDITVNINVLFYCVGYNNYRIKKTEDTTVSMVTLVVFLVLNLDAFHQASFYLFQAKPEDRKTETMVAIGAGLWRHEKCLIFL
ncbi:hypothetical protein CEXT_228061 [Caerostris extrusa]|uniref:Uncharacterized protein n=1 Tax=Caerostris extrusa TaxID=172846 RepID=A0AAV4TL27_CAEEX|nr:hypothetical protein CEXT_228061 [Caerostris extrusa]